MKNEDVYIKRRNREDNLYKQLQEQSLEMIQELSGNRWTDFNEHDPGVTLMDVLNYALLELNYTCEFPFEDFLVDPRNRQLHYEKAGLLPSQEIFTPVIVSTQDYESLILDRVKGLKDCRMMLDNKSSLYTLLFEPEKNQDHEIIIREIKKLYHRNRNLCENLGEIRIENLTDKDMKFRKPINDIDFVPEQQKKIFPPKKQSDFRSVQYDLPDCYGINEKGLPAGANTFRRNAALQLKAYLLIFDYLLSGVGQQREHIHQLLELSGTVPAEFYPDVAIEEIDRLLESDNLNQTVVFEEKHKHYQKSLFLDYLDMMYGENTHHYVKDITEISAKNTKRAELIRHFPKLNGLRFRSFNLLDEKSTSLPGIKQLVGLILGHEFRHEFPVINVFSRYNLKLVSDNVFFSDLKGLFKLEFIIENLEDNWDNNEIFEIPQIPVDNEEQKFYMLRNHLNLLWHNILFESFLEYGMHPQYYRAVTLHDKKGYLLLYKQPGRNEWINMGFFFEKQVLIETTNRLWKFIEMLNKKSMSFYLIEHILLHDDDFNSGERNKLTIVIPCWTEKFYPKEVYLNLFRERLPAHLNVNCLWLNSGDITSFEKAYFKWRKAWSAEDEDKIVYYSNEIVQLIEN